VIEKSAVEELLRVRLDALKRVAGGGNNLALRARSGERSWLVKAYGHHPGRDGRDRLEREFGLLSFLWRVGVRCVPEPVAASVESSLAVYSWIEGTRSVAGEIEAKDVSALARFLGTLWTLRERPGARDLPVAAEATFSARELVLLVERRFERLRSGIEPDPLGREALAFVEGDLARTFAEIREHALQGDPDTILPASERTLSPSDHGFHNALRTSTSPGWVFIDFEYGGWDDPAKMLADALLQPAVPIPRPLAPAFLGEMLGFLGRETGLYARFQRLYPLWSLKWCLIMLNEFLPQGRERRRRAGGDPAFDPRPVQLEKARLALDRLRNDL